MDTINLSELSQCRKCACFNLRKAARSITQTYDSTMQAINLRATQFALLAITQSRRNLSISELAELMAMDRTTLTRNLKPLEKRGLVEVNPGLDRRTKLISITHEGQLLLKRALPLWKETQKRVVENFGDIRFESLLTDLVDVVHMTKS